ncbi:MAG: hypothetical protein ABIJ48_09645 [Actinomycetota bacterium]
MINTSMDPLAWLRKQLESEGNDLLREMIRSFAEGLLGLSLGSGSSARLAVLRWAAPEA